MTSLFMDYMVLNKFKNSNDVTIFRLYSVKQAKQQWWRHYLSTL